MSGQIDEDTVSGWEYCSIPGQKVLQGGWFVPENDAQFSLKDKQIVYDEQSNTEGIEFIFDFSRYPEELGGVYVLMFLECS